MPCYAVKMFIQEHFSTCIYTSSWLVVDGGCVVDVVVLHLYVSPSKLHVYMHVCY